MAVLSPWNPINALNTQNLIWQVQEFERRRLLPRPYQIQWRPPKDLAYTHKGGEVTLYANPHAGRF